MQLHAIYTSAWEEGEVHTNAVICTISRSIVSCDVSDEGEDFEHHHKDSVQVEHNGHFYDFDCDQGEFTEQGKKDFNNLLEETLLKQ
jgi:hypothetical protein